jgi:hypothetical protein
MLTYRQAHFAGGRGKLNCHPKVAIKEKDSLITAQQKTYTIVQVLSPDNILFNGDFPFLALTSSIW